jgi:hypothetical protein
LSGSTAKYQDLVVDGVVLKHAIQRGLAILGPTGLIVLFQDLERHGILLKSEKVCSLKDVCKAIHDLFGGELAGLMMERIYKELQV